MIFPEDWAAACDAVATDLGARVGGIEPPVDVLRMARRLRVELVWDAGQTGRARRQHLAGQPAIFLRPDDRPERVQWAAAHELGEQFADRVMARLGLSGDELLPRQREAVANQLANRILLPGEAFAAACREMAGDLFRLKERFATASHELIAWRMLDLPGPRIVTVCDHGILSRRQCNFVARTPVPQVNEVEAWARAHQTGEQTAHSWPGGSVRVWPVHEPAWKREIAVTEVDLDGIGG